LRLAREAGIAGGTLPAVLNAANEMAVPAFLDGKIPFPAIWETVEAVMRRHVNVAHPALDDILRADAWARSEAGEVLASLPPVRRV
jgi:1-deoxy-D-xylulose-5-phosphate reductoisomerase